MLVRLLPIVLLAALVTGCQDEPEARYREGIRPCDLIPAATSEKLLDIGTALGPGVEKETKVFVAQKYCHWEYKQKKPGFFKQYKRGAVERSLTLDIGVYDPDEGGEPKAVEWFGKVSEESQPVAGIGDQAAWKTTVFGHEASDTLVFRRSNAVVTLRHSGRDCCTRDLEASTRRAQIIAAATAADRYLLAYR